MNDVKRKEDSAGREYVSLDLLKVIATVLIVFHHYQQVFPESIRRIDFTGTQVLSRFASLNAALTVELFFMLSGFFMLRYVAKIRDGLPFERFMARRYLRVFPELFTASLVFQLINIYYCAFCFGQEGENLFFSTWCGELRSFWRTLLAAFGVQAGWGWEPGVMSVNNPTWYVSILMILYMLFFFLTWLAKRLAVSHRILYAAAALLGVWIAEGYIRIPGASYIGRGMTPFFLGLILADLPNRYEQTFRKKAVRGAALIALVGLSLLWVFQRSFLYESRRYILVFLCYPALLILLSDEKFNRRLPFRRAGLLARVSFHVFVWHLCGLYVLSILAMKFSIPINNEISMILFTAGMYPLGFASHYGIERPVSERLKKWNVI